MFISKTENFTDAKVKKKKFSEIEEGREVKMMHDENTAAFFCFISAF